MKMKITILLILIALVSCSSDNEEEIRFMKVYKDILIAREQIQDSLAANNAVDSILKQNGYTQKEFKEAYFELATNSERFISVIDSVRNEIREEVGTIRSERDIKSLKKKNKKQTEKKE